ncbi:unnamed protein product [Ceutorhynchus assimilis]|uniref:Uncharacterized protein n=1 Tax=Ceutorhynchus assimilis TaxID=467358 RepID=A0A9N9QAQ7_9CUCU|nr:unnamed protein product [Ceutorhynchus assimilis]
MTEIENKMINMDLYEVFKVPKFILNIYGLWPKNKTNWAKIRSIISILNSSIFCIIMAAECIFAHHDFKSLMEVLTIFTAPFSYILKQLVFSGLEKDFLNLYNFLNEPKFKNIPKKSINEVTRPIRIAKTIGIGYQINCALTVSLYSVMPIITSKPLPVRFTIIDLGNLQAVMYLFQTFGLYNSASNNSSIDFIALGLMCIVKGQVSVLNKKIRTMGMLIGNNSDDLHLISDMKDIVVHHNKIIM